MMGTRMAPAYAWILISSLEEPFPALQPLKPTLFKRYIDDILIIWDHSLEQLATFLMAFNAIHDTISVTWKTNQDLVTSLDVDIN